MCIVIDTNALAPVFNESCADHVQFSPIRDWIIDGDGFIVWGGSKYERELKKAVRYLRLFRLLKDSGKAVEVSKKLVNATEKSTKLKSKGTKCNDQHIISIFIVSGCRLLCSIDNSADKYIKNKTFYPKKHKIPSIYRGLNQKHLLVKKNIVEIRNAS